MPVAFRVRKNLFRGNAKDLASTCTTSWPSVQPPPCFRRLTASILVACNNDYNVLASQVGPSVQCPPEVKLARRGFSSFDNQSGCQPSDLRPSYSAAFPKRDSPSLPIGAKSLVLNILTSNSFGWNILQGKFFSCSLFSIFCKRVGGRGTPSVASQLSVVGFL